MAVLSLYPLWRILSRAGFHPAWALTTLIPFAGIFAVPSIIFALAFGPWPRLTPAPEKTSWKAFARNQWQPVLPETAMAIRYYGIDGGLLAIYGLMVLGTYFSIVMAFNPTMRAFSFHGYGFLPGWDIAFIAISIVLGLGYLIMIPLTHPRTPVRLIVWGWFCWMAQILIILGAGDADSTTLLFALILGPLSYTLYTWYFLKSKRVNLTYKHLAPAP